MSEAELLTALSRSEGIQVNIHRSGLVSVWLGPQSNTPAVVGVGDSLMEAARNCAGCLLSIIGKYDHVRVRYAETVAETVAALKEYDERSKMLTDLG